VRPDGYAERFCAYVDILGFRQLLHQLSPPKVKELLTRVHDPNTDLPFDEDEFRVQSISDAVTLSAAVTPRGLAAIFVALETLTLDLLAEGYFVRGALVKGSLYHDDKMVFGPALVEAFRLESEVVKYPRVMVHSTVLHEAKRSVGKNYREHLRFSDDGPCFLHVLRWLDMAMALTEPPKDYPATLLPHCQSMIQKRFRQAIDEPRHFEKVQWFARYWNSIVPPKPKSGIARIKGAGLAQPATVWG
jgi:hypothetical protein